MSTLLSSKAPSLFKLFILFFISLCLLSLPKLSEARKNPLNTLTANVTALQNQNTQLQEQLAIQAESTALQSRQIQQLHTAIEDNLNQETGDSFQIIFRIITLFTLGLLLFTLYTLTHKYLPLLDRYKALLQKHHKAAELHHHKIDELTLKSLKAQKGTEGIKKNLANLGSSVEALQAAQQLSKDEAAIALDVLNKQLKQPLEIGLSEKNLATIEALLDEGHLDLNHSLKARALIAEQHEQWTDAIHYWNTVLLETPKNNEALLHIGYANYKLASSHREDQTYLNKAVDTYDQIMVSAPEYFEDAYGFDDQLVGPDEIDTNADEIWIYQQVEELIIKTDELKNYHSILNIACQYTVSGKLDDARECFEQVSSIYHAAHCKQLQEETDLDALRDQEWFKTLIDNACSETMAKSDITLHTHSKTSGIS